MKAGTWVQIVFYCAQRRFVVRGKLQTEFRKRSSYLQGVELGNAVFMNGYVPKGVEADFGWRKTKLLFKTQLSFIPRARIVHIRRLSKDVALAMEM